MTPPEVVIEKPVIAFPSPPDPARFFYDRTITSSADVVFETKDKSMQRWLTGAQKEGLGLGKPFAVAAHQGRLFVSDTVARSVKVFDSPAAKYFEIGKEEPGRLGKPMGIDTDNQGNLYVMDSAQEKVFIYNRDGDFTKTIGSSDLFEMASSLTVDPEGKYVYVIDTGGVQSSQHRVTVFDTGSGELLRSFGSRGRKNGEFNLPKDAAIGPDGLLYIVDSGNFRIQVMNPETGEFVRTFGDIGRRSGQFSRPKGIDIDSAGNVYVSDAAFGNIQIFTAEGQLLLSLGSRSNTPEPAKFMLPAGLAIDEDGRVYMVDQYFQKVDVFRPASLGENQGYFKPPTETQP
ncbi:MAG: hypothetical protein V7699_00635 [Porticoccus sp.]